MHTIKELFKIGNGPSSSHTMGPKRATLEFIKRYKDMDFAYITLYGSLALTGRGHLTDYIIDKTLNEHSIDHEISFNYNEEMKHPNTLKFKAFKDSKKLGEIIVYSIGGGAISIEGEGDSVFPHIYPHKTFSEIKNYVLEQNITLSDYAYKYEDKDFKSYLEKIYKKMKEGIDRGLKVSPDGKNGTLHGSLQIKRKAKTLYEGALKYDLKEIRDKCRLYSYAYATSEENASGGEIVTSPTCGASGVLPAVLRFLEEENQFSHDKIIDSLAVAGLIGNIIKFNGSISGAEAGCQAEIGSACAMTAAFVANLRGMDINKIEQSAEIALEHHLGLTCDPIDGYVQIPCIERNAVAAVRAIDAATLATILDTKESKISFDLVVKTMLETGKDLTNGYRETSQAGLAKNYKK